MLANLRAFLEGSFTLYATKSGVKEGLRYRTIDLLLILSYSIISAILPSVAELPMLFFPRLSRITVLLTCAIGRAFGALFLFVLGDKLNPIRPASWSIHLPLINYLQAAVYSFVDGLAKRYGLWAFLISISIPPLPLRIAFYSASLIGIRAPAFAIAVAGGTLVRTSIVFWLYKRIRDFRLRTKA